jgi:hypothetical protein
MNTWRSTFLFDKNAQTALNQFEINYTSICRSTFRLHVRSFNSLHGTS